MLDITCTLDDIKKHKFVRLDLPQHALQCYTALSAASRAETWGCPANIAIHTESCILCEAAHLAASHPIDSPVKSV